MFTIATIVREASADKFGPIRSAASARHRFAALAVLVATLAVWGFTSASSAGADTTIKAAALVDDVWTPGRHVTVVVTVKADRLLQGTLRVMTKEPDRSTPLVLASIISNSIQSTGPVVVEQPVEVPGGSEKQFVAVLPAEITNLNDVVATQLASMQIKVELSQGDTVLSRDNVTIRPQLDVQGVGVLPDLASNTKVPDRVDLYPDTQKAHLVTLPEAASPLDSGPNALEQLSTVIGSAKDLSAISRNELQRTAIQQWVNRGGHLVVDAQTGPIDGLPDAWQPGAAGFAAAGAGDVALSKGNAAAGKWNLAVMATRSDYVGNSSDANEVLSYLPGIPMQDGLGKDAGFRLPDLGALMFFLVVYVILVGPITFLILGRADKRGWAWVCIPMLAVLFTGVFSYSGAKLRNTTEASHATLIEVGPAGSTAFTSALVGSVTGGATTVELGKGWSADAADWGGKNAGRPPTMTIGTNGLEAQLHLEPGAFSTIRASGPAGYANALEVRSNVDGANVKGSAINNLDVELDSVVVMLGYSAKAVGTIPAHSSRDFTIERPRQSITLDTSKGAGTPELADWPTIEPEAVAAWGSDCSQSSSSRSGLSSASGGLCMNPLDLNSRRFNQGGMTCDNTGRCTQQTTTTKAPPSNVDLSVNAAVWIDHLRRDHGVMRRFGAVTAAGWTDQLDAPIHLSGGQSIHRGRTAVVARGPVSATDLSALTVRRETVHTGNGINGACCGSSSQVALLPPTGAAYRLLMPANVAGEPITSDLVLLRLPESVGSARILTPDGWKEYVRQPFSSSKLEIPLPAGSILSGVVIVQVDQRESSSFSSSGSSSSPDWQIRLLRAGERERLEKNLALWKDQQDVYNKAHPAPPGSSGPGGSPTGSAVPIAGSGGGSGSTSVIVNPDGSRTVSGSIAPSRPPSSVPAPAAAEPTPTSPVQLGAPTTTSGPLK